MGIFGPNTIKRGARVYEKKAEFGTREEAQTYAKDIKALGYPYIIDPEGNKFAVYVCTMTMEPQQPVSGVG